MEKSGRRHGESRYRRLLTAVMALFAVSALAADDISLFVSSFELAPGDRLLVELTVRDAEPGEVSLQEPAVGDSFALLSGKKERRLVDGSRATVVSREWKVSSPGSWSIGPFFMTVRGEARSVSPVVVSVIASAPGPAAPSSLRWQVADGKTGTGIPLKISLEAVFPGSLVSVSCPAPENALLEAAGTPVGGARGDGIKPLRLASWYWTPLSSGMQSLPEASISWTDAGGASHTMRSEPFRISVSEMHSSSSEKKVPGSVRKAFSLSASDLRIKDTVSSKESSAEAAATASSLASFRNREYTELFPGAARQSRLALEAEHELVDTLPVPAAAWKPVFVIGAVLVFTAAFLLRLFFFRSRKLFFVPRSLFFLSGVLAILAVTVYTRDPGPAGVLKGCDLYHIPEKGSSVVDSFPAGTAVLIGKRAGDWVYIHSASGLDGWVPSDAIIEYTSETSK